MRVVLLILISFITLTALPVGILLVLEPDGSSLGLPVEFLSHSLFPDFFISGVLALIIGGSSLVSLFMIMNNSPWSYKMALASGVVLVLWIIAELVVMPYYHWLQSLYLATGILIALTSYQLIGKAAF